jgi:hypothetical protein
VKGALGYLEIMTWITIYDARTNWGLWFWGAIGVLWVAAGLWLAYLCFFVVPAKQRPALARHPIFAGLVLTVMNAALAGIFLWSAAADYRDRSDLSAGRFSEVEGIIEGTNFVSGSRSTTMYIRLGQRWFKVPYGHPQDCWPRLGEQTRILFRSMDDGRLWLGLPAYTVLRMELTHDCRMGVWG